MLAVKSLIRSWGAKIECFTPMSGWYQILTARKKGGWQAKRTKKEEIRTRIEQKELWSVKVWTSDSFQRVMDSVHNPTTAPRRVLQWFDGNWMR
jgi:hypothetical protein